MTSRPDVTSHADHPAPSGPAGTPVGVVLPLPARRSDGPAPSADGAFTIDCADCAHRATEVCGDCVVTFVVGREPEDALVVDADEARAVRLLGRAGLVPGVRHEVRASGQ